MIIRVMDYHLVLTLSLGLMHSLASRSRMDMDLSLHNETIFDDAAKMENLKKHMGSVHPRACRSRFHSLFWKIYERSRCFDEDI